MSVAVSRETGVVTFSVVTGWPAVSQQIASRIIFLINEFNLQTRQTKARAEREFVEVRLNEVQTRLRGSEDSLQNFLLRNRDFANAPELVFERDRLGRGVSLWQQVLTSVTQAYEQARIDEIRNTPLLTVVEPPSYPVFPERRRLIFKGFVALVLGAMIGLFITLLRGFLDLSRRTEPKTYSAFAAATCAMRRSGCSGLPGTCRRPARASAPPRPDPGCRDLLLRAERKSPRPD